MPGRPATRLLAAAALTLLSAVALTLPWWRAGPAVRLDTGPPSPAAAGTWAGWEVLGIPVTALLVVLALAATGSVLLRPAADGTRALVAAAAAAGVTAAAVGLVAWGVSAAPGAVVTGATGLGGLLLAVRPPGRTVLTCALVAAVGTAVLPGVPRPPDRVTDGPFVRIAVLDDGRPLRSGEPALPASLSVRGSGLGELGGEPVVLGPDRLVAADASGRARVVATTGDGTTVLGIADGRVARLVGDALLVTGLVPDDPTWVRVADVGAVSPVGDDGSVWLSSTADPPGTVRRLDLGAYDGEQDLAAVYLPVVTVREPEGTAGIDVRDVRPVAGGAALRFVTGGSGHRLERLAPTSTGIVADLLAGALDPGCGLNSTAPTTALPSAGPAAVDGDGGIWLAVDGRLVRIDPAGALRAVPAPLPGPVSALLATADGAVVLGTAAPGALWRLPDAAAALADLPPVPGDCVAEPSPVGPPATLVPVANTGGDPLGVPLGVDGRWASGRRSGGDVTVVSPGVAAPVPLGPRLDGRLGPVWPDGGGGAWWLESEGPDEDLLTLVHAIPGRPQERSAPVAHPAPREGSALIPDLGGRPPLLGTAAGAFRIDGGSAVPVVEGAVDGGVVRADGRGWVLAGGRLLALDGDLVLGAVIEPGPGAEPGVPVVVQLAKGVPPDRLALSGADVGLDAAGRAVVVSGGVVLRIDDAGAVSVAAQDPRLDAPSAVEGGLVQYDDGVLLRVDLPE
ncbi:hypothetical protein ACVGOW_26995 [Pseudonocardia saturnea]